MSDLSPDARDLIAQAKHQGPELLGPSAEQRARLREKLTPLWAAEAPKPPARSGMRWKLATAVVIAGLSALGATAWRPALEPILRAGSPRLPPAASTVLEKSARLAAAEPENTLGAELVPSRLKAAAEGAPTVRSGSTAPQSKSVPSRRLDRKAPSEVALAPVQQEQHQAVSDQDGSNRFDSTPSAEYSPKARNAAAARGLRTPLQPARAERLRLEAAEDRTPERTVDTMQDPAPPSIDGELELLGAAQAALQKQRPSRALTLLQEHSFRFPTGSLVEERMAMQALALCALQRRHAAETVLSNLEARGSKSQLLPRVRSQCGL